MGGDKRFALALCVGVPAASLRYPCSDAGVHREGRARSPPGRILFESLRCILSGSLADPFRDHPPPVLSPTHRKDDEKMQLKDPTEQEDSWGRVEDAWDAARIL